MCSCSSTARRLRPRWVRTYRTSIEICLDKWSNFRGFYPDKQKQPRHVPLILSSKRGSHKRLTLEIEKARVIIRLQANHKSSAGLAAKKINMAQYNFKKIQVVPTSKVWICFNYVSNDYALVKAIKSYYYIKTH